jgi:hypothetical protein
MLRLVTCCVHRSADAQYAWKKLDGITVDGRRWKLDYAVKVGVWTQLVPCQICICVSSRGNLSVHLLCPLQGDFKFFGWKIPDELHTPSPSRSR